MKRTIRILVLEDSATDAELLVRELQRAGFEPQWRRVASKPDFLAAIKTSPDLIVSDYSMPGFDGLQALELLRKRDTDTPFILVSGTLGEENAVEAMKQGATDYLLKDRMARLGPLVERALEARRLRDQHRQAEAEVRAMNVRYARQATALMALTRACALAQAGLSELMRQVAEVVADTLEVERASIWRYDRTRQALVCRELFERTARSHSSDMVLRIEDFPSYFLALGDGHIIAADDASADARTSEFSESYLRPLGITSMLDATIYVAGSVVGVFRAEHLGATRHWTPDEQTFVIAVANVVSLLFADEERRQIEEQLRQSQKMEAIGQLAGGVAHDFNNILAAVLIQADFARLAENVPDEVRESLKEIRGAAERAADLTRQLLLFGRRQVMQPRILDLNEAVSSLSRMLRRIIGEDVQLQLHLHSVPLWTRADAGMLDQVLMNLAVNARDAMPDGGRLLIETSETCVDEALARLHPDAQPGRYVRLSISDSGAGIAPDILPRIFEPFYTTKEAGKGTGLGLATVFGIVKQHQGWLSVDSELGRGTNFQVFLRAVEVPAEDGAFDEQRPKPVGGSETILLAEDEAIVRLLTRATLERNGYRVLEAANGVEALEVWKLHQDQVALLLTDMVMPNGLSGHQLAQQLQQENPRLKVVFTSGYSAEIAGRELDLHNGETFLQKPFGVDQLLESVRRCLDARAG